MAEQSSDRVVALETFASWLAHHIHFAPRSAEALARMGVEQAAFAEARRHWEVILKEDAIAEREQRVVVFGSAFAPVRRSLRADNPPIESLGPLPPTPAEAGPSPGAMIQLPVVTAPRELPARATYQLAPEAVSPSAATTAARPPESVVPQEPEVRADGAAPPHGSFDPDETLPIPRHGGAQPAIPFSGETPPERVAQMFDPVEPRARNAQPGPDETALTPVAAFVMPKTGTFRDQLGPLVVPILSLDEYAELRARLTVYGEGHAPTLERFGVAAPQVHEAQRARFSDYFLRDPAAQEVFLKAMQAAIVRVREEREMEGRSDQGQRPDSAPKMAPPSPVAHADVEATREIDSRRVAEVLRESNILPFDTNAPAKPPPPSAPQEQSGQTELIKAFDLDELLGARKTELAVPALPIPIERFAQIQAALSKSRDRDGVLRHFGVEPQAWQAVAAAMSAALAASASLRSRYEDLYHRAMQA